MQSAFGVEHEISKAGDYQRASKTWERRAERGEHVENTATTVGGTAGLVVGAAGARDRYARQNPESYRRMVLRSTALPAKVSEKLLHAKPGVGTLAIGTAAAGTALAAGQYKQAADRKAKKYRRQPNAAMSKSAGPVAPQELQRRKKVQGVMGTTAAAIGLTAFGAKSGSKLLPKIYKGGTKGKAYARHLDNTADSILFAGAGIGGAAGLHQGALYRQDAKQKPIVAAAPKPKAIVKAYDPERSRTRRLKAYEGAGYAGAVGAGAAAARPNTKLVLRGMKESRDASDAAKIKYAQGRQMLEGSHPKPAQARAALDQAGKYRTAAKKVASFHPSPVAGKQRAALAGAAAASGAGALAVRNHRKGNGKPYASWFDRAKSPRTSKTDRTPVSAHGRTPGTARPRLPGKPPPAEMDDRAALAWQKSLKKP